MNYSIEWIVLQFCRNLSCTGVLVSQPHCRTWPTDSNRRTRSGATPLDWTQSPRWALLDNTRLNPITADPTQLAAHLEWHCRASPLNRFRSSQSHLIELNWNNRPHRLAWRGSADSARTIRPAYDPSNRLIVSVPNTRNEKPKHWKKSDRDIHPVVETPTFFIVCIHYFLFVRFQMSKTLKSR